MIIFHLLSLIFRGDNVDLSVINPRREKSGTYKVIFRNAQGQDERDIHVNIMGNLIPCKTQLHFYVHI